MKILVHKKPENIKKIQTYDTFQKFIKINNRQATSRTGSNNRNAEDIRL